MATLHRFVSTAAVGALLAAGLTFPAATPAPAAEESFGSSSSSDDSTPLTVGKYNEITNKRDQDAKDNAAKQAAAAQNAAIGYAVGEDALTLAQKATAGSSNRAVQIVSMTFGNVAQGLTAASKSGATLGVMTFGFDELMSLLFPPPQSIAQDIKELSVEMATDFADVQQSIADLSTQVAAVGQDVQTGNSFAAAGACETALTNADNKVASIQTYVNNYNQVFSNTWWSNNIGSKSLSAQDAQKAVYNQVFTGSMTPDKLQQSVDELVRGLSSSGLGENNSLIALCAEELIANAATAINGAPDSIVPLDSIESQVFPTLQQLVTQYATVANIGQTVSSTMGQLAITMNNDSTQAPQQCAQTPSNSQCQKLKADVEKTRTGVDKAYRLAGASWSQITGGGVASNLWSSENTFLAYGDTAWVVDIAAYGNETGFFPAGTSPLTSTSEGTGPASGTTKLSEPQWEGLSFTPASADRWNHLLRTEYAMLPNGNYATPGDKANNDCLPGQSSPLADASDECKSSSTTGQLMAAAGLLNGGKPVGDNLLIYTGSSSSWNLENGAWFNAVPLQWAGDTFPSTLNYSIGTMEFLDTTMYPNNGASVVVNDANNYQGTLTTSSIFPFVLYNQVGQINGNYNTTWQLTNNFDSSSTGTYFASVACQDESGSTSGINNASYANSPWTMSRYTLGGPLYCGTFQYNPPSSPANQSLTLTKNTTFYDSPELNLTGYVQIEDFSGNTESGLENGVYECDNSRIGSNTSDYFSSGGCPELWGSTPGYFTGNDSFKTEKQYLWPVIDLPKPNSSASLAPLGDDPNWVVPTQGSNGTTTLPAVDRQLFQNYIAATASVTSGNITAQVPEGVKFTGQPDAAHVLLFNENSKATDVQVDFVASDGATFTAAPTSAQPSAGAYVAAKNMACSEAVSGTTYTCAMTLPAGKATLLSLPVKVTGTKNAGGFNSGVLTILGTGGLVGADLGGKVAGSFGGVYTIDTDLSQFDQQMATEIEDTDYGTVYDLRATPVDTPANEIGKVQSSTTKLEASPYGVKLLGGYKKGTSVDSLSDISFTVTGSLKGVKSSVTQNPACSGPGCFTVSGVVGPTSKGAADVTLTIQSGDPKTSVVSVRDADNPKKSWATTSPNSLKQGDVTTLKFSLPVGVHDLMVWGTDDKTPFRVVVAPATSDGSAGSVFSFTSPNPNPTIYLPAPGDWTFTVTPTMETYTSKITATVSPSSGGVTSPDGQSLPVTYRVSNDYRILSINFDPGLGIPTPQQLPSVTLTSPSGNTIAWQDLDSDSFSGLYHYDIGGVPAGTYQLQLQITIPATSRSRYGPPVEKEVSYVGGTTLTVDRERVEVTPVPQGGSDSVSLTTGPGKPTTPAELVATTNPVNGEITLSWQPVAIVPEVDSYELAATPPGGGDPVRLTLPATTTKATFTPTILGVWDVQLSAVNTLGASPAASARVLVNSAVPPKPQNVDVSISPTGVVSAAWMSVASKPPVTGYHVGLYDPSGARVFEDTIAVTPRTDQGIMRAPEFFALGKDSVPGEWTFTVAADNDDGRGVSARGSLLLSQAAIDRMERLVQAERFLVTAEVVELIALDRLECESGLVSGTLPTGECSGGIFTPSGKFLGVLSDPGTSVTPQYCTGAAVKKTLDSCADVEGVVMGGTVEAIFTQSTLPSGESAKFAVWAAGTKIWESPDPVPAGATTTAAFTAPTATTTYLVTVGTNAPAKSVTTAVEVVIPPAPASAPAAAPAAPAAPSAVSVTGCSASSCPSVSGTRSGTSASVQVALAAPTTSLTIVDTSTGVTVFDAGAQSFAAGAVVPVTLSGLTTGANSFQLTTSSGRTYFVIR